MPHFWRKSRHTSPSPGIPLLGFCRQYGRNCRCRACLGLLQRTLPIPGPALPSPGRPDVGAGGGDVPVPGALQVSPVTPLALPCPVAAWCDPGPVRLPTTPSRTLPTPYTRPAGRQRPRVGQVRAALLAASSATRATRVRRGDVLASKGQDTRPWLFSSRHLYTAVRRCAPVSSARQFRRGWSHPARGLQSSPWWSG